MAFKLSKLLKYLTKIRVFARPLIEHIIGNGMNTFLWHDHWHPDGPLLYKYGRRVIHDNGLSCQAKVAAVIANMDLVWPKARSDVLVHIQAAVCGILFPGDRDGKVIWNAARDYLF